MPAAFDAAADRSMGVSEWLLWLSLALETCLEFLTFEEPQRQKKIEVTYI